MLRKEHQNSIKQNSIKKSVYQKDITAHQDKIFRSEKKVLQRDIGEELQPGLPAGDYSLQIQ